ncbi:MAG: ribulose-phosphate 3-epimerase, partial [Lachnospiraceae bacterium]|nr:ribulose-phosphate 3-epimerase [Lachnospiraceae bacterium]
PFDSLRWVLPGIDMILLMTVNPGFGGQKYIPCMTGKIASLRSWLAEQGYETDIQVDGGISLDNAEEVLQAGANILVAGSAVFGGDPGAIAGAFLRLMNQWKEGGGA